MFAIVGIGPNYQGVPLVIFNKKQECVDFLTSLGLKVEKSSDDLFNDAEGLDSVDLSLHDIGSYQPKHGNKKIARIVESLIKDAYDQEDVNYEDTIEYSYDQCSNLLIQEIELGKPMVRWQF